MTDEESIESKKDKMRQYMAADRKLEAARSKRDRRGRGGCLTSLFKGMLFAGALGLGGYLVWLWHPWGYEHEEYDALEHPGICSPGVSGTRTLDFLTIFGIRVSQSGESVICLE